MKYMGMLHVLRHILAEGDGSAVFFGGAGVSTESDIPDFRSAAGIYNTAPALRPEEILHHDYFFSRPEAFYSFYFSKMIYADAVPNAAHKALASLEQIGNIKAVITQNIDGLHQQAGSKNVIELHGSVHRNYCINCGAEYLLEEMLTFAPRIPQCRFCDKLIKPDVVLYGESLPEPALQNAIALIDQADTLIVGGTSLSVYPAAGLIRYYRGKNLIIINQEPTPFDNTARLVFREKIGEVFTACLGGRS